MCNLLLVTFWRVLCFLLAFFFLDRGQCKDQRWCPVCLWGACGKDPADSGAVGEWEPGSEAVSGWPAGGQWQGMRGILFHTLKLDGPKRNQPEGGEEAELNEYLFFTEKKKIVGVVPPVKRTLLFAHFPFNHHLSPVTTLFKTIMTSVKNSL